jgi:hypothetical protein
VCAYDGELNIQTRVEKEINYQSSTFQLKVDMTTQGMNKTRSTKKTNKCEIRCVDAPFHAEFGVGRDKEARHCDRRRRRAATRCIHNTPHKPKSKWEIGKRDRETASGRRKQKADVRKVFTSGSRWRHCEHRHHWRIGHEVDDLRAKHLVRIAVVETSLVEHTKQRIYVSETFPCKYQCYDKRTKNNIFGFEISQKTTTRAQ